MSFQHSALILHDLALSTQGPLIGVDEVGRGCLAGAVYVAAFHYPGLHTIGLNSELQQVTDSKQLPANKRQELSGVLLAQGIYAICTRSTEYINQYGISRAIYSAMQEAVETVHQQLNCTQALVLVDGNQRIAGCKLEQLVLRKGDSLSFHIAAASVLAKTARDQYIEALAESYPDYHWQQNKGYGTLKHRLALREHGPCIEHRSLFIRKLVADCESILS